MFASAVVPGAFYLDASVETDREQVERSLTEIVTNYRDGNKADVVAAISNQNAALQVAAALLIDQFNFTEERLTDISVDRSADGFETEFRLNADFVAGNYGSVGRRPTRWRVAWVKEDNNWKVRDAIRLDPMNGKEIAGWESFSRKQ